jgi:hypothetical protein
MKRLTLLLTITFFCATTVAANSNRKINSFLATHPQYHQLMLADLPIAEGDAVRCRLRSGTGGYLATQVNYRSYIGRDLNDLLREVPDVNRRLRKLLGRNYRLFMKNLTVSADLQDEQGFLMMHGLAPHMGTVEEAVFLLSFSTGKLHCAILSKRFGNRYRLFSEASNNAPTALINRLIYR